MRSPAFGGAAGGAARQDMAGQTSAAWLLGRVEASVTDLDRRRPAKRVGYTVHGGGDVTPLLRYRGYMTNVESRSISRQRAAASGFPSLTRCRVWVED